MHARRLALPLGGFAALALALSACTSPSPAPDATTAPAAAPVQIDLSAEFPDAIAAGVVTPLSTDVDSGAGLVQADGTVLITGTSDGAADDSLGVLDLATGDVDWLVEDDLPDGVDVVAGHLTPEVLTWSVEVEADDPDELKATLADLGGFVFALDRATGERTVLADASGAGGTPPGTYTAAVAVQGATAFWEGFGDDDTSNIYSRPLDGSGAPTIVASDAWGVTLDRCVSADQLSYYSFVEDEVRLNVLTPAGAAGEAVALAEPTAADRIVEAQCGTAFLQSPYAEDGGAEPDDLDVPEDEVVVEGENHAADGSTAAAEDSDGLLELVDGATVVQFRTHGAGSIASVALDPTWLTIGLAEGDDDAVSRQFLFHRPSGKVFTLPETSATALDLQNGFVTYGSAVTEDADALTVVGRLTAP